MTKKFLLTIQFRKFLIKRLHITGGLAQAAAVAPQKTQCDIERLYPAGSLVEAAAAPSRSDVGCNAARARWTKTLKKKSKPFLFQKIVIPLPK